MTKIINEGLSYHDMKDQVTPILSIDEFKSTIGEDSDIIVLTFIVSGEKVANDLVDWFERGYEWIIDSETSPGEVLDKKYYVFAELNRRSSAAKRIVELLDDMSTLTDMSLEDWEIKVDDEKIKATVEDIQNNVILNPNEYTRSQEHELNEWREIAGIPTFKTYDDKDEDIMQLQRLARIH